MSAIRFDRFPDLFYEPTDEQLDQLGDVLSRCCISDRMEVVAALTGWARECGAFKNDTNNDEENDNASRHESVLDDRRDIGYRARGGSPHGQRGPQ